MGSDAVLAPACLMLLAAGPSFSVTIDPAVAAGPVTGRLIVAIDGPGRGEPRHRIGEVVGGPRLLLARDVDGAHPGEPIALDAASADHFPPGAIESLRPGDYRVQAILHRNADLNYLNAPGDLYSAVLTARIDPGVPGTIALTLDYAEPEESLPKDTAWVRYLKLPSAKLSAFHGRPMFVRVAVAPPRGFDAVPDRRYPTWVMIGGYGARFTELGSRFTPRSSFLRLWNADDTPRFLIVHLDGAGPLGDPYQVNSANHGPYGDALVEEVLPEVERRFRGNGRRVLSGGSTGGWVSLALQVFYPDEFAGCWSSCADPVDFRRFQLVNIYEDANAFTDTQGADRPSSRDPRTGRPRFTIRREVALETLIGRGGSWALSGGQWGAWNATFGPRGSDGLPAPLWDGQTGAIDRSVLDTWRGYDLRQYVEQNWPILAPKLRGKVRIWMGDRDDYYLNEAMRLFSDAASRLDPPADFAIRFMPGKGHVGPDITPAEMLRQMAEAVGGTP
jgi:hypothetical protein